MTQAIVRPSETEGKMGQDTQDPRSFGGPQNEQLKNDIT